MSRFPNRKYVIFSTNETGSINYSEVMEDTGSTLRTNISGSLTFVKYDRPSGSAVPASVEALNTKVISRWVIHSWQNQYEHTHEQVHTILASDEWQAQVE